MARYFFNIKNLNMIYLMPFNIPFSLFFSESQNDSELFLNLILKTSLLYQIL